MVQKATKRKQEEVKTGNEMEGLFSRFSNEFEGQNSLRGTLVETGGWVKKKKKKSPLKNLNLSPANTLPLH